MTLTVKMSQQQTPKNHKPRRPRHNSGSRPSPGSQSPWTPQDGEYGGSGSSRKNKGNSQHQGRSPFSKIQSDNQNHGELQRLLDSLPNSRNRTPQGGKQRRGNNNGNGTPGGQGGRSAAAVTDSTSAAPEPDMANDEESIRLNSAALRRIDGNFLKLHGTASQVAVYRYNPATKSWDKTDTVGCLFLYERNIAPRYGLVVMNRKNANNFIQCFGSDGSVVLQTPYLLLRSGEDIINDLGDGTQVIHCIWFYDTQDCMASAKILRDMGLKFEGGNVGTEMLEPGRSSMNSGQLAGNALFQILQQNKKPCPSPMKEAPMGRILTAEELESEMLHDTDPINQNRNNVAQPTNGEMHTPRKASESMSLLNPREPICFATPVTPEQSVFQKFTNMSLKENDEQGKVKRHEPPTSVSHTAVSQSLGSQNQMRTVEQLEREMKARTAKIADTSTMAIQNELMQTLGISIQPAGADCSVMTPSQSIARSSREVLLDRVIGKCIDDVEPEDIRRLLEFIDPSDLVLVTVPGQGDSESRLIWKLRRSSSLIKENESTFTTPTGDFGSASATRCSSQEGSGNDVKVADNVLRAANVKALSKDQLREALIFLLRNDSDFLTKLHNGYLQSLQEMQIGRPY